MTRVEPQADRSEGRRCADQLGLTEASALGALILHTGGLVIDDGWLRVYGGGGPTLPSVGRVNALPAVVDPARRPAAGLVVAHDVLGGVFAVNGADPAAAGRPGAPGELTYFAPDTLRWDSLGVGHAAWMSWLETGGAAEFYAQLRWPGWQVEAAALTPSQGIAVYPFLFTEQAHAHLAATHRSAVPMRELLEAAADAAQHSANPTRASSAWCETRRVRVGQSRRAASACSRRPWATTSSTRVSTWEASVR